MMVCETNNFMSCRLFWNDSPFPQLKEIEAIFEWAVNVDGVDYLE